MRNYGHGAKQNGQKPQPWGQFCGPQRQFSHGARSEFFFGGVASRVPWGWRDSFGKTGNLAAWVTKVCLKCTEKLG